MIDTSKKFLVAGAGKSGIGSVNLLLKTGADVSLYDGKEDLEKEALYEKLYEKIISLCDSGINPIFCILCPSPFPKIPPEPIAYNACIV